MTKRTKIICTIGPASDSVSTLTSMIRAGMNVARQNFSHGTPAEHRKLLKNLRTAAKKTGEPVAALADLQGPKIRLGALPAEGMKLTSGSTVVFSTDAKAYAGEAIPLTYKNLHTDIKKGDRILIDDGLIEGKVTGVKGSDISVRVKNGGIVTSHKGLNFPDTKLSLSSLTKKDREDARFAVQEGFDWVAVSFVTGADDILALRSMLKQFGKKGQVLPRIMAKIEKPEAIKAFDDILHAADGIMIARGDLGIEIPAEEVPVRQKEIIDRCRKAGIPVVVATQMLDSMIRNPRPTRAEVNDVANAVFDHTDAVMLSGETATGTYPLKAVKMMAGIIEEAEASVFDDVSLLEGFPATTGASVGYALKILALSGHIDGILAASDFGGWTETMLIGHPEIPLYFFALNETEMRQANIRWGVKPMFLASGTFERYGKKCIAMLKRKKEIRVGHRLAIVYHGEHGIGFDLVDVK